MACGSSAPPRGIERSMMQLGTRWPSVPRSGSSGSRGGVHDQGSLGAATDPCDIEEGDDAVVAGSGRPEGAGWRGRWDLEEEEERGGRI